MRAVLPSGSVEYPLLTSQEQSGKFFFVDEHTCFSIDVSLSLSTVKRRGKSYCATANLPVTVSLRAWCPRPTAARRT